MRRGAGTGFTDAEREALYAASAQLEVEWKEDGDAVDRRRYAALECALRKVLNPPTRVACVCCGRQIGPLDDGRCGHCGANRHGRGDRDEGLPCNARSTPDKLT